MDRRRLASLAAIAVAGFSSLATAAIPPTPPPSVDKSATGSVHLSAEVPVAVRELRVRLPRGEGGPPPTVTFTQTALLSLSAGEGDVRLSVVPATALDRPDAFTSFRSVAQSQAAPRSWTLTCDQDACEGTFGLLVEWLDPAKGETADVDWSVKAHVDVWAGAAAGVPTVEFTAAEVEPGVEARLTSAAASGDAVRFDADNRLAQWRVWMRLGDDPLEAPPGWPVIVYALLAPTSTVIDAPTEGGEPAPLVFIEGADVLKSGGRDATLPGDSIEFEPFWACLATESCTALYTIGLVYADSRPDVTIDAGWNLDVRAIGVDGVEVPLEVSVTPVPPMPMIAAKTSGTMVLDAKSGSGAFRYTVAEGAFGKRDAQWDGLRLPTRGLYRATMTWTGISPIPPSFNMRFGPLYSSTNLAFDAERVFSFTPGDPACRVGKCHLTGELHATPSYSGTLPADWGVRIDWELEVGMGTTAVDGQSELTISASPSPSP